MRTELLCFGLFVGSAAATSFRHASSQQMLVSTDSDSAEQHTSNVGARHVDCKLEAPISELPASGSDELLHMWSFQIDHQRVAMTVDGVAFEMSTGSSNSADVGNFRGFPIPVYGIGSTAGSVGCFLPGANIAPHRKGSRQCIFTSMPDFSSKLVLDGDENANRPTEAAQSVLAGSEHDCSRWGLPTSAGPQMVPSTPLGWLI